ncbi:MAG TPA: hypothetical protein PK509_09485 [Catalimonadaceae bacterium]|nr:hypothetical protein [Catalimonadaceae bacterium]HPI12555.1 hypothetical protein [Catalimonadaceae bacterium]
MQPGRIFSYFSLLISLSTRFAIAQDHNWTGFPTGTNRNFTHISVLSDSVLAICADSGSLVRINTGTYESGLIQLPLYSPVVSVEKIRMQTNGWKQMILTRDGHLFRLPEESSEAIEDTLPETVSSNDDFRKLMDFNIGNNNEIRYGILYGTGKMLGYKFPYPTPRFDIVFSTGKPVQDIYPYNTWNIMAIGDSGKIWKTVGLADPFQPVQHSLTTRKLNHIFGKHDARIWIAGDSGTVLFSENSGQTWTKIPVPTNLNLFGGTISDSTVWLCGESGTILYSTDEGETWTADNSGTSENLRGIAASGQTVFCAGEKGVIRKLNLLTDANQKANRTEASITIRQNEISVQNSGTTSVQIRVLSPEGKSILNEQINGTQTRHFRISGPGIYMLQQVPEEGIPSVRKFIVLP